MTAQLAQTVARIHVQNGKVIAGLGFLAAQDYVLTSARVVARALHIEQDATPPADSEVTVDFPMHISRSPHQAKVVRFVPAQLPIPIEANVCDLALLKIETGSDAQKPLVALIQLEMHWFKQQSVAIVGFGDESKLALGAHYSPAEDTTREVPIQLDDGTIPLALQGAPVWDKSERGVTGLLHAVDVTDQTAPIFSMIPVSAILAVCPELDARWRPRNPYRGLHYFQESDHDSFLGRDQDVNELVRHVSKYPLCTLIGPSGSGKSSLIFAGLIPALRAQTDENWLTLTLRPRSDPFSELARAMIPYLNNDGLFEELEQEKLAKEFSWSRDALALQTQELLEKSGKSRILIVIDQFEELFTFADDLQKQHRFLNHLLRLVASAVSASLVISVRADYLSRILEYPLMSKVLDKFPKKTLGAMGPAAFRHIIEQPAQQLGVELEPELVKRLQRELEAEPRAFSLLEFALTLLWEKQQYRRISATALDEVGSIHESLSRHTQRLLESSTQFQQDLIRKVMLKLVRTCGKSRYVCQKLPMDQFSPDEQEQVQRLTDNRILTVHHATDQPDQVELIHEILLREWPLLSEWIEQRRELAAWREDLRQWVQVWKKNAGDESYLLQGKLQLEAEENLDKFTAELHSDERKFIRAGAYLRRRSEKQESTAQKLINKRLVLGLSTALVISVTYAGWQWWTVKRGTEQVVDLADQTRNKIRRSRDHAVEMEKLASLTVRFLVEQNPSVIEVYIERLYRSNSRNALMGLIEASIASSEDMDHEEREYWRSVINSMSQKQMSQLIHTLFMKSEGIVQLDYTNPDTQ